MNLSERAQEQIREKRTRAKRDALIDALRVIRELPETLGRLPCRREQPSNTRITLRPVMIRLSSPKKRSISACWRRSGNRPAVGERVQILWAQSQAGSSLYSF